MELISILPNLGIGVVAVLSLVYVTKQFLEHLREIHKEHKEDLAEQRKEIREVEKEVRTNITAQLSKNTHVMEQALLVIEK